jgi:hypothetical protein
MLDDNDLRKLEELIALRELNHQRILHPERFNPDGSPKPWRPRRIKQRVILVAAVMVTLAGADHVVHLEWMVRGSEMMIAAFFDWLFSAAKDGRIAVKKPTLPLPPPVKADTEKETV